MPGDGAEWSQLSFTALLHFPVDHVPDRTYITLTCMYSIRYDGPAVAKSIHPKQQYALGLTPFSPFSSSTHCTASHQPEANARA